jgi:hypothetical protein
MSRGIKRTIESGGAVDDMRQLVETYSLKQRESLLGMETGRIEEVKVGLLPLIKAGIAESG